MVRRGRAQDLRPAQGQGAELHGGADPELHARDRGAANARRGGLLRGREPEGRPGLLCRLKGGRCAIPPEDPRALVLQPLDPAQGVRRRDGLGRGLDPGLARLRDGGMRPMMNLQSETLRKIDEVIPHYPVKRSAALPLLHLVQEDQGFISNEAIEWIAARLELQPINIYELVTFYPMFRQKPIGRRHIKVCRTLSCAIMGGYRTCSEFQKQFGTGLGEVSPDGEVTVEFVECLASCGTAPVVLIDDVLHEKVDAERARELSEKIRSEARASRGNT